ncbi:phosphomevalonate kinase-like [Gigantopelta aegis]|uniref:phosphomevalonate kinase-like n=1 Tax=Gigantopelta aegis TaxID=1735272 RepID=UPI001B88D34D|nr:phosphomevalonate kinase-like [Gigantopelta aegis]
MLPTVILVFSGKRKSGKDYVTDIIQSKLTDEMCAIMRLSAPLKKQYALEHDLDFDKLLDASEYKERYRREMIVWGEEKRNADPGFFCRHATSGDDAKKPVWIISDARRKTDIAYFKDVYPDATRTVRVVADEEMRTKRGFVFTAGVDDAESECGLDDVKVWDFIITNNDDSDVLNNHITIVTDFVNSKLGVALL